MASDDRIAQLAKKHRVRKGADDAPATTEESKDDLDNAAVQDEVLAPKRVPLSVEIDGKQRAFTIPTEPTLGERKRVLRHIASFAAIFNQELMNRIGIERMTVEFLSDRTHQQYAASAALEPAVRDKAVQIASMIAQFDPVPTEGQRGPTLAQLDDGLGDGDCVLVAFELLRIINEEHARQKNSQTGATEPA